ncbi:flagellar hook protein FlgE [Hydrogenophilus thiooxidans]|uniref:flagellar hook protein FlgE n=1 Tax=Hydrogenophilus thiooxidans TaxID=2820326 RepID=UPI001C229623|nr:flagellar hook protein FlgE [Hydrogenophilus thiooxidans]
MAFQQGLSGLSSSAKALDVISHNVANANTTGFKANQTVFADVYSTTLGANPYMQVGSGVSVPAVRQNFSQGSITTTGNALDMAINGEGFFITKRPVANDLQMFYTRAGEFQLDKDGYVISANGYQLLGYPGAAGAGDPQPIRVPFDAGKPAETSQVEMTFNLDAGQPAITAAFDANDPETYNFSTSVQVYDSLGIAHNLTFYFRKTAPGNWEVYGSFDGDSTLVTTNPIGTLTFDGAGALTSSPNLTVNVTSPLANGADFGGGGDGTVDVTLNATQYSLASSVTTLSQDGRPAGELASVSVTKEGRLQARYTNGDVKDIATVAIATFRNPNALISMGDNMWAASLESGQAAAGIPGSGTRGFITGGAVESSNVDLTAELVNMIIQQRAYQANAQSIRTQDQILQTVINLR